MPKGPDGQAFMHDVFYHGIPADFVKPLKATKSMFISDRKLIPKRATKPLF